MKKENEIQKLKSKLMNKIQSENGIYSGLNFDEVISIIKEISLNNKYAPWIIREYLKGNIQRFEDMERAKQALILFKNNLNKFPEQQKQLSKMSFQELETLVEPYQDILTQNEIKRMNKEKIWSEIDIIYAGPEGRIYVPKTKEASIFLGQGTKWCTASIKNNMFEHYNKEGLLYIFVTNDKDKKGREVKYQLHFETGQFMDSEDKKVQFENLSKSEHLLLTIFEEKLSYDYKIRISSEFGVDCFLNHDLDMFMASYYNGNINFKSKFLTEKLLDNYIKIFPEHFYRVPDNMIEKLKYEDFLNCFKVDGITYFGSLNEVPLKFRTQEFFITLFESMNDSQNMFIGVNNIKIKKTRKNSDFFIPENIVDKEFYEKIVHLYPSLLDEKNKFCSPELYKKVVLNCQNNFGIPAIEGFLDDEIVSALIKTNTENFYILPEKYKTSENCFMILNSLTCPTKEYFHLLDKNKVQNFLVENKKIFYPSDDFVEEFIDEEIILKKPNFIVHFRDELFDLEFYKKLYDQNKENSNDISIHFGYLCEQNKKLSQENTIKEFYDYIFQKDNNNIIYIDEEYHTNDMKDFIKNNVEFIYLNKNIKEIKGTDVDKIFELDIDKILQISRNKSIVPDEKQLLNFLEKNNYDIKVFRCFQYDVLDEKNILKILENNPNKNFFNYLSFEKWNQDLVNIAVFQYGYSNINYIKYEYLDDNIVKQSIINEILDILDEKEHYDGDMKTLKELSNDEIIDFILENHFLVDKLHKKQKSFLLKHMCQREIENNMTHVF